MDKAALSTGSGDGFIPTLTHATERDIDLLLIEELRCSPAFVKWFLAQIPAAGVSGDIASWDVLHSVRRMHNRREIDLFLTLTTGSGETIGVLIENKLDAADGPKQAESYREECEELVRSGGFDNALSVLVCPEKYASENLTFSSKFDALVSYEAFRAFLVERARVEVGELRARLEHRSNLIDQAITKSRRGYEAVPVVEIDGFNSKYVDLCQEHYPQLVPGPSMLRPGRPGESKTMIFGPKTLPKRGWLPQTRIVHQLREGNVNINFYAWGNYFDDIASMIQSDLQGTPFKVAATLNRRKGGNSGLMIYSEAPPIDNLESFEDQKHELQAGMRQVDELRQWFEDNLEVIERWSLLIEQAKGEDA